MYKGTREQVFTKAKRPIQEMWIESDCLQGSVLGANAGLGASMPKLIRIGRGRTSHHQKD